MDVRELPLAEVTPSRNLRVGRPEIAELAESIAEHGVLQPIRVRRLGPGRYQIIAGHRRFAASKAIGLRAIPAVVVEEGDAAVAVQSVVENLQRENLSPFELVRGIRELQSGFGMSAEEIAKALSKSALQIRTYLRAARLPDEVLERLESGEGRTQEVQGLTLRHVAPFIGAIPLGAEGEEAAARTDEATDRVRQLFRETDDKGIRINAHMADAIGQQVTRGRMTVAEAVQQVLQHPEQYRYSRQPMSPEELEADTWGAYRKLQRELAALAYKLRPEVASAFSDPQRLDLLEGVERVITTLVAYREALLQRPQRRTDQLPAGSAARLTTSETSE